MAHIASCLANSEPKSTSPTPSSYSVYPCRGPSNMTFSARLLAEQQLPSIPQQSQQQQRYQLFPRDKKLPPIVQGRSTDSDRKPVPPEKDEAALAVVRGRLNSHNLIRRRKISVPELGPMTTVHEAAMDSPTIPGRPALHERSSSAPEESAKAKVRAHMDRQYHETIDALSQAVEDAFELIDQEAATPRRLAPLVIPNQPGATPPLLAKHFGQMKPAASASVESLRPPCVEASPLRPGRLTPDSLAPRFADRIATPASAPGVEGRGHFNGLWELPRIPASRSEDASRVGSPLGHARGASDSGGIMDRGRPRKRVDPPPNNSPVWQVQDINEPGNIDRKAFEELPCGVTVADVAKGLGPNDAAVLRKQAVRQAEKFEILSLKDVETLSKELRQLDDRTTYLRRTYMSLRAGRRNLHSRICQYLRATHGARFSHEAMLKQEEALAELDASIDEWFNKLEQAENRRMRVRQKLLEHVAAAAILPPQEVTETPCCQQPSRLQDLTTPPRSPERHGAELPGAVEQQQPNVAALAETAGSRCGNASPPPMPVVPRVPSNILELSADEPLSLVKAAADAEASEAGVDRGAVESIRIYAGSDLLELLTDVENEITRLSKDAEDMPPLLRSESQVTRHARALTHEKLSGEAYSPSPITPMEGLALKTNSSLAGSAGSAAFRNISYMNTTTTTINEDDEDEEEIIYLTSAVYQPPK